MNEIIDADILVVGGGAAGIRSAIEAASEGLKVLCLSKGPVTRSGITPVAAEGYQVPCAEGDSPRQHYEDTVSAGRGLSDRNLAYMLARGAEDSLQELLRYGARFKRDSDGRFIQSLRPGQAHKRNCFLRGGGWGMMAALKAELGCQKGVLLLEDVIMTRLLLDSGRAAGAVFLEVKGGELRAVRARAVVLAVGGYEELWPFTDCPSESTGEGHLQAFDAGAAMIDLEQVLYYPTVLIYPRACRGWMLQYEYLLNPEIIQGRLLNGRGEEFIEGFPGRDEIVRRVYQEMASGRASPHGGIYLDLTRDPRGREHVARMLEKWLSVQFKSLLKMGIDLTERRVEMAPAAHYCLGGVQIDEHGGTQVPGLFAAGEATGNVHGANRMSGNALTETMVFGRRAGRSAVEFAKENKTPKADFGSALREEGSFISRLFERAGQPGEVRPWELKKGLQELMWRFVGPSRREEGLKEGLSATEELMDRSLPALSAAPLRRYCQEVREAYEAAAMGGLAQLILRSALERRETRGHHFREDFPERESTPYHTRVRLEEGRLVLDRVPIGELAPWQAAEPLAEFQTRG